MHSSPVLEEDNHSVSISATLKAENELFLSAAGGRGGKQVETTAPHLAPKLRYALTRSGNFLTGPSFGTAALFCYVSPETRPLSYCLFSPALHGSEYQQFPYVCVVWLLRNCLSKVATPFAQLCNESIPQKDNLLPHFL